MARPGLKGSVKPPKAKADAEAATANAAKIAGNVQSEVEPDYAGEHETVSYNLPVELIELVRDLAEERLKVDRREKRLARRRGEKPPQARRSASLIVREALEAHRDKIKSELEKLRE